MDRRDCLSPHGYPASFLINCVHKKKIYVLNVVGATATMIDENSASNINMY